MNENIRRKLLKGLDRKSRKKEKMSRNYIKTAHLGKLSNIKTVLISTSIFVMLS